MLTAQTNGSHSKYYIVHFFYHCTHILGYQIARLAIGKSRVQISSSATVYQSQLSVLSLSEHQRNLGSKRAYHAMHICVVLWLRLVSGRGLHYMKRRSALPYGLMRLGKNFIFYTLVLLLLVRLCACKSFRDTEIKPITIIPNNFKYRLTVT